MISMKLSDRDRDRLEEVYSGYRLLWQDPAGCRPMIVVNTPPGNAPTWEQRLADPMVMLHDELDTLQRHLEIEDDYTASVRVQFGTAQVAAAFGCDLVFPENNLPACGSHVLARAEDVADLAMPSLSAGWYGKLAEWTELWKKHLPDGVHIQHPDIQSPFNTAHLIRGSKGTGPANAISLFSPAPVRRKKANNY